MTYACFFRPRPGDIRGIKIEKTTEMLGITIDEGSNEGVFVSTVSKDSLASQVGLQVGDQILEVYGVNVRSCGKENAARVMSNRSNTLDMKVQFNPEYFPQTHHGHSSPRQGQYHVMDKEEEEEESDSDIDDVAVTSPATSSSDPPPPTSLSHAHPQQPPQQHAHGSESPTPRNSPRSSFRSTITNNSGIYSRDRDNNIQIPSGHSTLTRHQIGQVVQALHGPSGQPSGQPVGQPQGQYDQYEQPPRAPASPPYEPRVVYPTMKKSGDLGVRLVRKALFYHL